MKLEIIFSPHCLPVMMKILAHGQLQITIYLILLVKDFIIDERYN